MICFIHSFSVGKKKQEIVNIFPAFIIKFDSDVSFVPEKVKESTLMEEVILYL